MQRSQPSPSNAMRLSASSLRALPRMRNRTRPQKQKRAGHGDRRGTDSIIALRRFRVRSLATSTMLLMSVRKFAPSGVAAGPVS